MGIILEVVDVVEERAAGAKVVRVALDVGALAAVQPDALRFSFEVATQGTSLEGARLEIHETPGDELRVREMEVV